MTTFAQKDFADSGGFSRNDIFLDSTTGQIAIAKGLEAYGTLLADAIRTLTGELQLDTTRGIPYMTTIFIGMRKVNAWKMYVRKRLLEFDFVQDIPVLNVQVNSTNKTCEVDIRATTDMGLVKVSFKKSI